MESYKIAIRTTAKRFCKVIILLKLVEEKTLANNVGVSKLIRLMTRFNEVKRRKTNDRTQI